MTRVVISRTAEGGAYIARRVGKSWIVEHRPPEGATARLGEVKSIKAATLTGRLLAGWRGRG